MAKTFLYQIVMSFFGIMMYTATRHNTFLFVAGQISLFIFYAYILSSQMYKAGFKAYEYDSAHQTASPAAMGFIFALIAFLPTLLLAIFSYFNPPILSDGASRGSGYIPYILNKSLLQGMYIGVVQHIYPTSSGGNDALLALENSIAMNNQSLLYLILPIPGILVSGISYVLGCFSFKKPRKK
jgi:hypothetical protein